MHGASAIESALAIGILVAALAGLMEIVNFVYESDRMDRAARAAARAAALDPGNDACAAARSELGLADTFDCSSAWSFTVSHGVAPSDLATVAGGGSGGAESGEMVVVRIGWSRPAWSLAGLVPGANAVETDPSAGDPDDPGVETATMTDDSSEDSDSDETVPATSDVVRMVSIGFARRE